jgi:Mrp family chromosome partitioning ATPase
MSEERRRPDQGRLRLAVDRKTPDADSGSPAERGAGASVVPVFEDLPVFEEQGVAGVHPGPVARTVLDERSLPGEQFRLLSARLRALGRDKRLRRVGVVSASLGEGKTTVSLGLARALALERQRRVLLLEFDLRRPALDQTLGLEPPAVGLRQYLEGEGDVPSLRRLPGGFWMLSAGHGILDRPEVLSSPRMARLLDATDRVFDFLVVDCPPLLPVADAVVVQDLLDGFVFVVRSRHSPRETIQRAVSLLKPGAIAGLVLNGQHDILPSYREYAYRRYGKS